MKSIKWLLIVGMVGIFNFEGRAYAQAADGSFELYSGGQNCVAQSGYQNLVAYGEPGIGNLNNDRDIYVWCPAPRLPHDGLWRVRSVSVRYVSHNPSIPVECYPFLTRPELTYVWGTTKAATTPIRIGAGRLDWTPPFVAPANEPFKYTMGSFYGTGLRCKLPRGNSWIVGTQYIMFR